MSCMRTYKILIERIIPVEGNNIDISNILIEIKDNNGKIIKNAPINSISKFATNIETQDKIKMFFTLFEGNVLGARQPRVFADGSINIGTNDIEQEHFFTTKCTIKNIINNRPIFALMLMIQEDHEKVNFNHRDFEPSYIEEESEYSEQESIVKEVKEIEKEEGRLKKKGSPVKWNMKKPIRTRRFEYSIKNETTNYEINNKVTDEMSNYIENLRIDVDEAISSMEFYGKNLNMLLAQVLFKTNPSEEDIKQLKIKIPESEKAIDILLKTIEGSELHGTVSLPELDENESLKIDCTFKDHHHEVKGKIKFNYKDKDENAENINHENESKMQLGKEVALQIGKEIMMQINREDNHDDENQVKQQLSLMPFLFGSPKKKRDESPSLKFPKIKSKDFQKLSMVTGERTNFSTLNHDKEPLSSRSRKTHLKTQTEAEEESDDRFIENRKYRSRTLHSRGSLKIDKISTTDKRKCNIRIVGVSIKFYPYFRSEPSNEETVLGKCLLIYSNSNNIYESEQSFEQKNINWNFRDCQIEMSSFENLTFELIYEREKESLAELNVSYNQLKFNQEENSVYFGYLTKGHDVVAKICVDFRFNEQNNVFNNSYRMTTLDRTEVQPRNRRFYSEEICLESTDEIKKESPTKSSLNISHGGVYSIPEIVRRRRNKTVVQGDSETVRDKRKSRILSPKKKFF